MAEIISAALKDERERRIIARAAEHEGKSVSAFVREAALRRAVAVARSLPESTEQEESHAESQ